MVHFLFCNESDFTRLDLALHGKIHSLLESLRPDIDSLFSLSLTIVGYVKSSYCIKILINE